MALSKERQLERLQTFSQDPNLASFDEASKLNDQIEPISKVFELFLGQKDGEFMSELNQKLEQEVGTMRQELSAQFDALQTTLASALDEEISETQRQHLSQLRSSIEAVERRFQSIKTEVTPKAGQDFPTYQELFEYIEEAVPALRSIAVDAVNVLEMAEGDARLDAKAIRNLEENIDVEKLNIETYDDAEIREQVERLANGLQELAQTPPRVIERTSGGALQFVEDSTGKRFQGVTKMKFSGATVSKDGDTLVVTVTGGGGALAVETPTGTINGSNASFTVTTTPAYIVSDGISYFDGAGYSITGTAVTMDIPPSQFIRAIR